VKLGIVVLAHRSPEQLALLLRALRHPQVRVYLHVDSRIDLAPFARVLANGPDPGVVALKRRPTRWGGIELVDASLDGLRRGIADDCGYFVLVSGQDFPLRPVDEIVHFLEDAGDRSYLEYWTLPTPFWRFGGRDRTDFYTYTLLGRRETCFPRGEDISFFNWKGRTLNQVLRIRSLGKPPRRFPPYLAPFAGWQWWNLSRAAADHVLAFVDKHPDYRAYHRYTWCPDELFFHSILLGTDFARRHELMNDDLRFKIWPEGDAHPHVLTIVDLPAMLNSGMLFARKFDAEIDGLVLSQLASDVRV
jgi:hypothetical protein